MADFETWHLALIEELRAARLGTVSRDGRPHLIPVCYTLADGCIWIPIDEKPKSTMRLARIENIERDSRVSVLFDRYSDDWAELAWVRVDGEASVLAAGRERPDALAELRRRYGQYKAMDLEGLPLIRIVPTRVAGWRWDGR